MRLYSKDSKTLSSIYYENKEPHCCYMRNLFDSYIICDHSYDTNMNHKIDHKTYQIDHNIDNIMNQKS